MAKVRKIRVRWSASTGSNVVGYKLYWAVGGGVNYDSDFNEVGKRTEVILPDEVPSFALVAGDIELGVTAVTEIGNESDMAKFSLPLDFTAPDAPMDIVIESREDFWWSSEPNEGLRP